MTYFKCIGQAGILLELIGAAYMVYAAYTSRCTLLGIDPKTFGGVGQMAERTHEILNGQVKDELIGFSFLAIGLLMQFASGF